MKVSFPVLLSLVVLSLSWVSCSQGDDFYVEGYVEGAAGKTVYLERLGLKGVEMLDSAEVSRKGYLLFKQHRPEYPDLYRLRMEGRQFVFAIDSCEHIVLMASAKGFAFPDRIEGSDKVLQLQELRRSVAGLQKAYGQLGQDSAAIAAFLTQIEEHKEMARRLILSDPRSIVAYYAIFQKVGDYYIFSPYEKADRPYCAAVATAYHTFMPEYERSKNLYRWVLGAMQSEHAERRAVYLHEMVKNARSGFLDIELPDIYGETQALSSLIGKVFLLDFSAASAEDNVAYTFALRELYNKYHAKGFDIYQVSADNNFLLWQQAVSALPWICVRDERGVEGACFRTYNVDRIPTTFLFDRNGDIIERNIPFSRLPSVIEQHLK